MSIIELQKLIIEASSAYYYTSEPIISDVEFDNLIKELRRLDSNNKLLTTINWGAINPTHKEKFPHTFEVGGLDKIQSVNFDYSIISYPIIQSSKLDGITGVAYYKDGKLLRILTRNDGTVGLDVTSNLIYCNIPKVIDSSITYIHGEIVTTWDASKKFDYSHPRNMSAGIVNSDNISECNKELHFVVYDTNLDLNHEEKLIKLELEGFEVVRWEKINSSMEFEYALPVFDYSKPDYISYDYPVDGSVITSMDQSVAFAIKYPTPNVKVKVLGISNQISERGRVTPVIEIEPTKLSGCTITRCSGFNYEKIIENGVGVGSIITITRANEVIPDWLYDIPTINRVAVEVPTQLEYDGILYYTYMNGCQLEISKDKTMDSIKYLLSIRSPLGIAGAKIQTLIDSFGIKSHKDIVLLSNEFSFSNQHEEKIFKVFGSSFSDRIIELLYNVSNGYTLAELLKSSFSKNLGSEAADRLMKYYFNDSLIMLEELEFNCGLRNKTSLLMPSYGVAEGIKDNIEVIKSILNAGFNIIEPIKVVDTSDCIPICMTGKLSKSRSELTSEWKGKVVEVDINKAKYLITDNPSSPSSKNKAAQKLNIPVITENEFRKILGE